MCLFSLPTVSGAAVDAGGSRLSTGDGYAFDASGNTTVDAQGRTFVYDAENKQVEVKNSADHTIGSYYYDGDGKRVKKIAYDSAGNETETGHHFSHLENYRITGLTIIFIRARGGRGIASLQLEPRSGRHHRSRGVGSREPSDTQKLSLRSR